MLRPRYGLLATLVAIAAPAQANEARLDVPKGRLGDAAVAAAQQTGSTIVVVDENLSNRKVGPLRGTMTARQAAERLARASGGHLVVVNGAAFRIERAPTTPPRLAAVERPAKAARRPAPELPPEAFSEQPIVVVASKRDLTLRDFPGQVHQIDGSDLVFGGVGGTDRIAARIATVSTTHLGTGRNKLFIRGIADSSFTGPTQSTVGQYLGDLRLSYNAPDPDLRLSDMRAVEVLEGPQGALYGAGSLGGIVRFVPNDPDLGAAAASGIVGGSVTARGEPGFDANLVVNLPLAEDRIGLRVAADGERQGGYIDKPLLRREDVNRTWVGAVRGSIRARIAADWTLDLIGLTQTTRGDDSQYADRGGAPLERSARVSEGYGAHYGQGQIVLSGRVGDIRLRSSTGAARQDLSERYDATLPDGPDRLFVQRNRTLLFANETRIWQPLGRRFGWLAGISYTHNNTRLQRELQASDTITPYTGVANSIEEFTLYGEASVRLFEGLVASAGGRLTWSTLDGAGEDVRPEIALANGAITAQRTERMALPSLALTAHPLAALTMYLRYQEGFRPGGLTVDNDFVRRFRNDRISTIEFGLRRGSAGRGPFDLAASVSFTDWRDIQADYIDLAGLPTTANVGNGQIWTFTLTGSALIAPGLRIDAGGVINRSRISQPNLYADVLVPSLIPITEVPNVAKVAARIGVDYRRKLGSAIELHGQGWARYVGQSRLGVGPELGDLQGDYLETGATIRLGTDAQGATLSITNIPDVAGNRFALGTPFAIGRNQVTPLRPLTVRLGFDARF
ncbi:TonB-dependent receptor [Novosphingobium aquiterrae]|uniref:TonB-dependent receptor n=1 Tax=Novosphingobium aquiterrae TaxID=624388 RepID=A0ABV6PIN6_9SPHN